MTAMRIRSSLITVTAALLIALSQPIGITASACDSARRAEQQNMQLRQSEAERIRERVGEICDTVATRRAAQSEKLENIGIASKKVIASACSFCPMDSETDTDTDTDGDTSDDAVTYTSEKLTLAEKYADKSVVLKLTAAVYEMATRGTTRTSELLNEAASSRNVKVMSFTDTEQNEYEQKNIGRLGIQALSDSETDDIAERIADAARVYTVTTETAGTTCYIAVDLREKDAEYLKNPYVLRKVSELLLVRTRELAAESGDVYTLMDYTHIAGELQLHYIGYRVTDFLGGEQLSGLPLKLYNSCKVADLNIDEERVDFTIRVIGNIVG